MGQAPAVLKMERRADMYISTLQSMIRAMGGQLKIEAVFPEGRVEINQFRKLKVRGWSGLRNSSTRGPRLSRKERPRTGHQARLNLRSSS
jgi:hypothetical protein